MQVLSQRLRRAMDRCPVSAGQAGNIQDNKSVGPVREPLETGLASVLLEKIENRTAVVAVIGLGYVGLQLAVGFAEAGFNVVGIETEDSKVNSVNRGISYIRDVPSEKLSNLKSKYSPESPNHSPPAIGEGQGSLVATLDYDALLEADIAIICVPTPLSDTREPNFSYLESAADETAKRLHPGMLIVLESTSYPGSTEDLILPRLEASNGRSYRVGTEFFLVFSPERLDPGRADWTILNTPKVIGGVTSRCRDLGTALYQRLTQEVVPVSSPKTAEMVKLLENTFRATNIALANEFAMMCDRLEIDVWEVIQAAQTKPFGFMRFSPGPGVGGHCLPVDPQYLAWKLKTLSYNARFIQLGDEINRGMPAYWVEKVQDALSKRGKEISKSNILIVGVAYKRDVSDIRESPALDILDQLIRKGANVAYHDPYIPLLKEDAYRLTSLGDSELGDGLASADCVVIVTDHSVYDWDDMRSRAHTIVDTRNALGGVLGSTKTGPVESSNEAL